jgi:hypothetical protein
MNHPSAPIPTAAPSPQWIYGLCSGGPLDGLMKDIPANAGQGRTVVFDEGIYTVGRLIPEQRMRWLIWRGH